MSKTPCHGNAKGKKRKALKDLSRHDANVAPQRRERDPSLLYLQPGRKQKQDTSKAKNRYSNAGQFAELYKAGMMVDYIMTNKNWVRLCVVHGVGVMGLWV